MLYTLMYQLISRKEKVQVEAMIQVQIYNVNYALRTYSQTPIKRPPPIRRPVIKVPK